MFNRIVSYYNRLFALWVILGAVAAFFYPHVFLPLRGYMELFFAFTMFGIGMVLNLKEFSLGLILTGSAPGAMASNVLSYLAKADVAYSVSLTTSSTLLAPLFTPSLTLLLAHTLFKIPFWAMFLSVVKMVVMPLFLGFSTKRILTNRIDHFITIFPAISTTFIVFICSLVVALNKNYIINMNPLIFLAVLTLNIGGLAGGYLVGKISNFDLLKKRALSIEIGMQNAGLGSVLALKHFNEHVALPAVIFVFVCIFTASFLVQMWSKSSFSR